MPPIPTPFVVFPTRLPYPYPPPADFAVPSVVQLSTFNVYALNVLAYVIGVAALIALVLILMVMWREARVAE